MLMILNVKFYKYIIEYYYFSKHAGLFVRYIYLFMYLFIE